MKKITFTKGIFLLIGILFTINLSAQKSGVWVTSGSGASTTWSTTAGGVGITASATGYGSGTSYTLNDFVTSDTMGCNNSAYSDGTIVGNPSLSIRHTFPNTAQLTFTFTKAVENPVMHFDRLGGGQVNGLTSSSLVKILTPGITLTELSGNDVHFITTATTIGREAGQTYTSLPSECGPPNAGTASGSVRLNGVFQTVTFEISMDAASGGSSINDRWEIAFSEIQTLTLDFDGVDDYINRTPFLGNKTEITMMSWIKLDNNFNGGEVLGQRNFRIFIDNNNRLKTFAKTNGATLNGRTTPDSDAPVLSKNLWYHVASIYNGSTGSVSLFLNGDLIWFYDELSGSALNNETYWSSDHDFEIGRNSEYDSNYFEGSIYETRVYGKALTEDQLQRQIYQEIVNNSGNVRGTVISKDIDGLLWSDLLLYYKMDILDSGQTTDESTTGINGSLHNMRTYQDYTAPLPYVTKSSGNWNDENNWLHGNVWDIADTHSACAIIKIEDNIETNTNHETVGLIIESGNKLTLNNNAGLHNSWYLELNGDIDLQGESQLIQTEDSELAVTSSGKIEIDQQGTKDLYTYNYWASPVGVSSTSLNNTEYRVPNVLRNGTNPNSPSTINFVDGYNGSVSGSNISIAKYWIWKFNNLPTDSYASWQHVSGSGVLKAGEGYTMKGVSNTNNNVGLQQNYVFIGKPNNGDIELDINENNDYLVGNPYPSAIDAEQFILDNGPTIAGNGNTTGTLYFWEHWGGGSHILSEYQGGYATYNLAGGVPAASKGTIDADVDQSGPLVGNKTPGRYIPVGQGFFVTGEATGKVKFNNGQRVFKKESTDASVFLRGLTNRNEETSDNNQDIDESLADSRMKIRLGFNSINELHRQLLITVDERATVGYDWGFDGVLNESQMDDMYWMISDDKYIIQGINEISEYNTVLPLGITTSIEGNNSITIDNLENIPNDTQIFLHDIELGIYHNLRDEDYTIYLPEGEHLNRFEVVFSAAEVLSTTENEADVLKLYYATGRDKIVILNPNNLQLKSIELFNILGKSVYTNSNLWEGTYGEYEMQNLSAGAYIVKLYTENNITITKKILAK